MWRNKHTEHILAGLPKHLAGEKNVQKVIKELIQNQWILPAKKTKEEHYSLNPNKADEILQFYEKHK